MASFDENGKYIKTNWKAGDKITATKLNKIEESIEAVNDNDISRHVEADARLDALEAKNTAQDKELTNIKNTIADNKAAAELGDYEINSRMQFLENELNEGIEEVHNVASTVDGKIATAEANMTAQVNQGKADMEAMVAEVEADLEGLHARDDELNSQLEHNTSILENLCINCKSPGFGLKGIKADGVTDDTENLQKIIDFAYNSANKIKIVLPPGNIKITDEIVLKSTTLNSAEFGNIVLEGAGSGSTIINSYISQDDKACISIDASSRINIKNISLINNDKSVKVTGLRITGSSMLCNIENVFAMYFEKGFEHSNCVGTFTNCFVNSCKCGFYSCAPGTAVTFNSCYASQCRQDSIENDYDGCGYYIRSHYTTLNACGSDSNYIAYYIANGIGISLNSCGCEVNDYGVVVNGDQIVAKIDSLSYHAITNNVIKLQKAHLLNICNIRFNLDGKIPVYIDYETATDDMIRFTGCNFFLRNSSLYIKHDIPNDGYGINGYVTNIEHGRKVGRLSYNGKTLELKLPKGLSNGFNININIDIMSDMSYTLGDTMINDRVGIKVVGGGDWSTYSNTDNVTVTQTTDNTHYIYQITGGGTQHSANTFIFKIQAYTNSLTSDLDDIILISGIHY